MTFGGRGGKKAPALHHFGAIISKDARHPRNIPLPTNASPGVRVSPRGPRPVPAGCPTFPFGVRMRTKSRRLGIELLEGREVPAAVFSVFSNGALFLLGSTQTD